MREAKAAELRCHLGQDLPDTALVAEILRTFPTPVVAPLL
jgi:hypothetical protein